ncbi:hypothetical protein NM688_g2943 [Phlebia brevispora]|uniref:Uncharacterized protein n=1 Tax=Phlebia brevispora TaxID=194682 RepID=A0ACC1T721_9APHY|nr:hypothetical protein NM688_g2943 [Phlebia brevispora]
MPASATSAASGDGSEREREPTSEYDLSEGIQPISGPSGVRARANFASETDLPSDVDSDGEPSVAPRARRAYLAHLSSHMAATSITTDPLLGPSYFAPAVRWTGAEKEVFFRALAVHSGLRPDLIAAAVRTKGISDVIAYIDALNDALSESLHRGVASSAKSKGKERATYTYTPLSRDEFLTAHEVSAAWIEREEQLARAVTADESQMVADATERQREEEVHKMRRTTRARKRRKVDNGGAQAEHRKRDRDKDRDREGEKARRARFETWLVQRRAEWEVRDAIDALDGTMLRAMDMLLRENEEAKAELQSEGTGTGEGETQSHEAGDLRQNIPAQEGVPINIPPHANMAATGLDDSAVRVPLTPCVVEGGRTHGPPLLDTAKSAAGPRSHVISSQATSHTAAEPSTSYTSTTSVPLAQPQSNQLAPFQPSAPPASDQVDSSTPSSNVDPDTVLDPTVRRRIAKRLYMRKKRAEARGDVADTCAARMKPGRKSKSQPPEAHDEPDTIDTSGEKHGAVGDDGEKSTPHVSGKTLPYKTRERLESLGIGVEWLQQEGLDFFHLGTISRFMRTYSALWDADPGVNLHISADVLRLMLAHVVYFTTQVVRMAMVSREQEIMAKVHTKVWRIATNQVITAANIDHALSLLGVEVRSKREHFQRLLDSCSDDEDESDDDSDDSATPPQTKGKAKRSRVSIPAAATDPEAPSVDDSDDEESEGHVGSLPIHRLVFPPLFRLPTSLQPSHPDPSQSLLTHIPWARTAPEADEDEDLLPLETDEEALEEELKEEAELDDRDRAVEASHEQGLWEKFGEQSAPATSTRQGKRKRGRREDESQSEEDEDEVEAEVEGLESDDLDADVRYAAKSLRYRQPGGRIKSAPYIEDSD